MYGVIQFGNETMLS